MKLAYTVDIKLAYTYLYWCQKFFTDIQCNDLSTPANGEITSCSSGKVGVGYEGDTCGFTCNTGYELTGSDTRTCLSDGSWSGSDDVCGRGNITKTYKHTLIVINLRKNEVIL